MCIRKKHQKDRKRHARYVWKILKIKTTSYLILANVQDLVEQFIYSVCSNGLA